MDSMSYRMVRGFATFPGSLKERVGDLIRQVVSFLASETILERRREPMSSLLCWYCTRSQQKSPEINAKSVRCDSYHDQVPEEEVPFVRREPDYKPACTLRRFMCRGFPQKTSITCNKQGKIYVKRWILRPTTLSRYSSALNVIGNNRFQSGDHHLANCDGAFDNLLCWLVSSFGMGTPIV